MCVLDTPAQCICYNPNGTMLAVGLGEGVVAESGEWRDYEAKQVTVTNISRLQAMVRLSVERDHAFQ